MMVTLDKKWDGQGVGFPQGTVFIFESWTNCGGTTWKWAIPGTKSHGGSFFREGTWPGKQQDV